MIEEYTNRQIRYRISTSVDGNPVKSAALRRLSDALPPGPHTPGELRIVAESIDMSGLAESTRDNYRGAIRSFIRDLA